MIADLTEHLEVMNEILWLIPALSVYVGMIVGFVSAFVVGILLGTFEAIARFWRKKRGKGKEQSPRFNKEAAPHD